MSEQQIHRLILIAFLSAAIFTGIAVYAALFRALGAAL